MTMDIAKLMSSTAPNAAAWDASSGERAVLAKRGAQGDEETDKQIAEQASAVVQKTSAVEQIEALRETINTTSQSRLLIDREENNGKFIYRIFNPETGETMRQWPPEKYLDLIAFLRDQQGGIVDEQA